MKNHPFISNNIQEFGNYLTKIKADYHRWQDRADGCTKVKDAMFDDFCENLNYKCGKKYMKVMNGHSVHSFIVLEDEGKFKAGDILKPASWAAPAKNFARGNILDPNVRVAWTSAH